MTHKTKECLSRPRKVGARWSGRDIHADEVVQQVELGWDGKRDRWNGYDPREHDEVVAEYQRLEELRREEKEKERGEQGTKENGGADGDSDDKDAEELGLSGQTFDAADRISTRNLRIREDTAKYLLNLDLNSAKYDPKTRTMVNGAQHSELLEEENFMRSSGDAAEFEKMQRLAWNTRERGDKIKMHLQANPTEGERFRQKQMLEQDKKKAEEKKSLLDRYGGGEYLSNAPLENDVVELETYVEYASASGEVKRGQTSVAKSKYEEDNYHGNHTSVWGSWWKDFQWGYACCHSIIKKSYCTGTEGIKANEEAEALRTGRMQIIEDGSPSRKDDSQAEEERERPHENGQTKKVDAQADKHDKAKRKHMEMIGGVTEEEMETYRKQKRVFDDPMADYLNK